MDYDAKQPPADLTDSVRQREEAVQALYNLLDKNMADFDATLAGVDKAEIADMKEVTDTREIYDFIRYHYGEFEQREAELLLRMENPLKFIVDNWPCYNFETLAMNHLANKEIEKSGKGALPQTGHDTKDAATDKKPSVLKQIKTNLEQLKANRQKTCQQSITAERPKGSEAR